MKDLSRATTVARHSIAKAIRAMEVAEDKEAAQAVLAQWDKLVLRIDSRQIYGRRDKIREELANDPRCYD